MKEKIYIVADFFADEYLGGAELTTSSLLSYCFFGAQQYFAKCPVLSQLWHFFRLWALPGKVPLLATVETNMTTRFICARLALRLSLIHI